MRGLILLALNLCATAFFLMGGILVILVGTWIKDLPVEDRLNLPRWEIFVVAGLTVALFAYFAAATAWLRSEHFGSLSGSKKSNKNPKMASNDVQQLLPLDPDHGRAKNVCYINHIYPIEKTVFLTAETPRPPPQIDNIGDKQPSEGREVEQEKSNKVMKNTHEVTTMTEEHELEFARSTSESTIVPITDMGEESDSSATITNFENEKKKNYLAYKEKISMSIDDK